MNIWICDDDKVVTTSLAEKIKQRYTHAHITQFQNGLAVLQQQAAFDVLLLDIDMPEMNGLTLAQTLRAKQQLNPIIFVTAYEQYVFQAYDVQAFHYLVKPFETKKVYEVLKKALNYCSTQLVEQPFFVLKNGFDLQKIYFHELYYVEVFGRKLTFHLERQTITVNGRLKQYEAQLDNTFFKINRSYVVNLRYVASYTKQHITLDNGVTLSLAQKKYSEFVGAYMGYIQQQGLVHT